MSVPPDLAKTWRSIGISLLTASLMTSALMFSGYLYARSHDPWLTPRHTHYMHLYWRFGQILSPILSCLILGNAWCALTTPCISWRYDFLSCAAICALTRLFATGP
jgi:hypothetical protein